jgi:alpha-L-fucosidase
MRCERKVKIMATYRVLGHLLVTCAAATCLLSPVCLAQQKDITAADSAADYLKAGQADVQKWRDLKFGLFIHWGPVSLKGTEIGWSRGSERRGTGGKGEIPVDEYDNLYKSFNPIDFNADQWVQLAKDTGTRYLVFTSKHHDGFSMFDSKLTDYKITNSPFKRDVVKELADACHKADLKLGFYYSPVDWYHPDYRTENHRRYIKFLHGQLRELCTNYGKIDIVWFDGLGGSADDWDSHNLLKMVRTLQPGVIINNRAGLPADHDTPEQTIGKFQTDRPWETCMTLCDQWAWKPNDRMKSLKDCVHTLVRVVGGDGNFLFNVGPMPDGRIEPRQADRLREIGTWLRKNGQSIYGTRGGPYKPGLWGASTYRDNKIFLHVLNWPQQGLILPAPQKKVVASSLLNGGDVTVKQTAEVIKIAAPKDQQSDIDTIIVLELDGPASQIPPTAIAPESLTSGKKATASNIFQNSPEHSPEKAVDDDQSTRWATDSGTTQAWLEVDLGKPLTFDRVTINEAYDRIRKFELQRKDGEQWVTFFQGTTVGSDYSSQFPPVTTGRVRLNIIEASEGPTVWEFQLFPPQK